MKDDFEFFWRGIYSQWHKSSFMVIPSQINSLQFLSNYDELYKFNCCEQFMMFCKAILFNDITSAEKILKTSDPKTQKKLGREVANFDISKWNLWCDEIVYQGNFLKFTQNIDIKNTLLSVPLTKKFVEASPLDTVWGIGFAEDNPLAWDEKTWRGENKLGLALDRVRLALL